jgi:hypothetical protein
MSGNSEALQSKSSGIKKKRGNSEAVGSKPKKSKNTWRELEESTEGLENRIFPGSRFLLVDLILQLISILPISK